GADAPSGRCAASRHQKLKPPSRRMFETPQAVAFSSKKAPLRLRAPAMKLKPLLKSVSLKSNRLVSATGLPLMSTLSPSSVEKPRWLNAKLGPAPTYGDHRAAPDSVYSTSRLTPNIVVTSPRPNSTPGRNEMLRWK